MNALDRKVVLVTRRTRLEDLLMRHHTLGQARFYIEHLGADFGDYEREHVAYQAARETTLETLQRHGRFQVVDRGFLPNFLFGPEDVVVALGQDGLVANTMKYLSDNPLVGLNPEPARYDGVLLPFAPSDLAALLPDVLLDHRPVKEVTMAQAVLGDGQTLHAVNDLFIGPRSHVSARYEIRLAERVETQSSSGIIVATGLGSTAWLRSVVTGSMAIAAAVTHRPASESHQAVPWNADFLQFAVREPFPSKATQVGITFGEIPAGQALILRSLMPENGVIFSDGIEADHLDFNSGTQAHITVSPRRGRLVT